MAIQVNQDASSPEEQEQGKTINDVATALFVVDLERALDAMGCSPQYIEESGVCISVDTAHDFITAGPCFELAEGDPNKAIPSKIEVMRDGENDTIMSSGMPSDSLTSVSDYEAFGGIESASGGCAEPPFWTSCLKSEK